MGRHLFDVMDRLTRDGGASLSTMTLGDVGAALWVAKDGWTVLSSELGWHYVMYLAEHPEHGIGVSLVSTQPSGTFEGVGEMASEERWQVLNPLARANSIRSAIHVQARNRLDVLGLFLDLDSIGHFSRSGMTALGFLLESPAFMDATTRTMVSLNPVLERLIERVYYQWERQSLYGVRPGGMLSPQDGAFSQARARTT